MIITDLSIREIAEQLLERKLMLEDGVPSKAVEVAEAKLGVRLPTALRSFYLEVGNLDCFTSSFQVFVEPDEIELIDGKMIFLEENQGVCRWGIDLGEDDPTVYQILDHGDFQSFFPEEVCLSAFLNIIMFYQMAQGGYEFCGSLVDEANTSWDDVFKGWRQVVDHNRLAVYYKPGRLLWCFTDENGLPAMEGGYSCVYLSARTEEYFLEAKEEYGFAEL